MASEQKGLKIGLGEAGNKVSVRFFVGNTAWGCLTSATLPPTPYTHSNAQEFHFSCRYSKEAWCFASSNNDKSLELRGLNNLNENLKPPKDVFVLIYLLALCNIIRFLSAPEFSLH